MLTTALNASKKITVTLLLGVGFFGVRADDPPKYFFSDPQGYQAPRWVCQYGDTDGGFPLGHGCQGRIGLIRLSRTADLKSKEMIEEALLILFGTKEFPRFNTEITIKRSAHLRTYYWPDRDHQNVGKDEDICVGPGCFGNKRDSIHCKRKTLGEQALFIGTKKNITDQDRQKLENCPGPTDYTDYLAAGTVVKILDYKIPGNYYHESPTTHLILIEVISTEYNFPLDVEKKYNFDHREII